MPAPCYIFALLIALAFTLATTLQLRVDKWTNRTGSDSVMKILLGDGRRMFAYHFYVKADVYFHSGYYPSIFDQGKVKPPPDAREMTEVHHDDERHDGPGEHQESEHEKAMDYLGQPKDWIDRFGRNFYSSKHSHLDSPGKAKEILPWLRISADLDPERVETYTVAAYWLRDKLNRVEDAEEFLREGLRANPNSYEILFALGEIYYHNRHDIILARNLWELALRRFREQVQAKKNPDIFLFQQITTNLAHLEEEQGNLEKALEYREQEITAAPEPEIPIVRQQIEDLKAKIAAKKVAVPGK